MPVVRVVAAVRVLPEQNTLSIGSTIALSASPNDAAGSAIDGKTVTWSSSDNSVATVNTSGVVTGNAVGSATIGASSDGKSGTAQVSVTNLPQDYAITAAQITQGAQAADGSIPVVLNGNGAAINVLIAGGRTVTASTMQVVLRIVDALTSVVVRTDTAVISTLPVASPSYASPTAQFLIPQSVLRAGLKWQIVRDPRQVVPDDTLANDSYPRSGFVSLATVTVPTLKVRFVPIVLSAHNDATGTVNSSLFTEYLRVLKSVHPLGIVVPAVRSPLTTSANFGTAPSGGGTQAFWLQVIAELDLARLADPTDPDAHWYGIVRPPSNYNFVTFGGFSYIPPSGSVFGASTRTSASVQVGWFTNEEQARDLVAHELGHTFGRRHSPCGGPANPDPAYPVSGGFLDQPGFDVYSWSTGNSSVANAIPVTRGDIMGYCLPPWSSVYTYSGVLAFRGITTAAVVAAPPPEITRVLVVRGTITNGSSVTLDPTFVIDARPSAPERTGSYRLMLYDAAGSQLYTRAFEPAELDHTSTVRAFLFTIPATLDLESRLSSVVVSTPFGTTARLTQQTLVRGAEESVNSPRAATAARGSDGATVVRCGDPNAKAIAIANATTGALFGTANAPNFRLRLPATTSLTVSCSDGLKTERTQLSVP